MRNAKTTFMIEGIIKWLSIFVHQFTQLRTGQRQIRQGDLAYLTGAALSLFPVLATVSVLHFFFNDSEKVPQILYMQYRFGMAAAILLLGMVAFLLRGRALAVRSVYLILATLMSVVQAWSMTLGPQITIKWVVWLPTIVFMVTSNSFFFSALWLGLLVLLTHPYWEGRDFARAIFSDFTLSLVALAFGQIVRRISITARINYLLYEEASQSLEEEQKIFYTQISRFISPVLLEKIDEKRKAGLTPVAALDAVLKRRRSTVAVMFSDIRDFSSRADETDFIENELIPSSASIIDPCERNCGIAKQIGDAVIVFYDLPDAEEGLLRALADAFRCAQFEANRVKRLNRIHPERYFSIAYGSATVGNMASVSHRETTIIGYPANLSARIDSLTKERKIADIIRSQSVPCVMLSAESAVVVGQFAKTWN